MLFYNAYSTLLVDLLVNCQISIVYFFRTMQRELKPFRTIPGPFQCIMYDRALYWTAGVC